MKKLIAALCLITASSFSFAVTDSYVARMNEEGKYCAKVNVGIVGAPYFKTKCYTLEGWKDHGFIVETK